MENQNTFRGWATCEVMGHQSHAGFVTTEVYGQAVLFRIDTPELPESEETLAYPERVGDAYCPKGTVVKRPKLEAVSVLVGSSSIYRLTPCTEEVAILAHKSTTHRPLLLVRLPEGVALPAPLEIDHSYTCCGASKEDGHTLTCSNYDEDEDQEGYVDEEVTRMERGI